MIPIIAVIVLLLVIFIGVVLAVLSAPEGYEDKNGFHRGRKK